MLRLLGILTIVNLLFGGHHHRRGALRRGILLGAILGFFANRDSGADRAAEEFRERTGRARETLRQTAEEIKQEIRDAKREIRDAGSAERVAHAAAREAHAAMREAHAAAQEARTAARVAHAAAHETQAARNVRQDDTVIAVKETPAEAAANEDLVQELERNARTAAMMSDVPVIHFPEDDPKYNSSKKYGYA